MMKLLVPAVLALTVLSGCKKEEPAAPAREAAEGAAKPTEQAAATAERAAAAPPPAMAPSADPVDVCALISKEDIESVVGKLMEDPKADSAQGSLLGGCSAMSEKVIMVSVSARPANEFDATVKAYSKKGDASPVSGIGEAAVSTGVGLFVQPDGKPYFLHVMVMPKGKLDPEMTATLAKKIKL